MMPHRPPLTPIRTAALMICTRDRPDEIADCLTACASLIKPADLSIVICVADNNAEPQEESIRWSGAGNGLDLHYGHEPRRGYASVRNCALDLARAAGADIAIFIDDDSTPDPGLVAEHVDAMLRYGADAILGRIEGLSQRPQEGRRVTKAGTGNVSMRRWVFDPTGAGIRFDDRLNLLGFEDWEFFGDLIRSGGLIFQSTRPVSISRPGVDAAPTSPERPYAARRAFAMMEGRNEIAVTRIRHGFPTAAAKALRRHLPLIARGLTGVIAAKFSTEHGTGVGRLATETARLRIVRGSAGVGGLWRPGFERPLARRGELVELKDL